jgi:glyoxylate reductase
MLGENKRAAKAAALPALFSGFPFFLIFQIDVPPATVLTQNPETMSQRAALLIGKLTHAGKEWKDVAQVASKLHEYPSGNREDFISRCKKGEFDGVYALYRSNDSNPITGDFNAELLDALPKSLKYICHNGAGYNNIDVAACTSRGLSVSSTPIAVNDATADVAIWLMLGALRNIKQAFNAVNQGV